MTFFKKKIFVLFILLTTFLEILRNTKREHRLPLPDTVHDRVIVEALAFLNWDWIYIESCQWPLGMLLFSYTQRLHE